MPRFQEDHLIGNGVFAEYPFLLFWTPILGIGPTLLILLLCMYAGDGNIVRPSTELLTESLGCDQPTLASWIRTLKRWDFINWRSAPEGMNYFKLKGIRTLVGPDLAKTHLPPCLQQPYQDFLEELEKDYIGLILNDE